MAAAIPLSQPDVPLNTSSDLYSRRLTITELDFKDTRYPALTAHPKAYPSPMAPSFSDRIEDRPVTSGSRRSYLDYTADNDATPSEWTPEKLCEPPVNQRDGRQASQINDIESQGSPASRRPPAQSHPSNNNMLSQNLPSTGASMFERESREERLQRVPSTSGGSAEPTNPPAEPASPPVDMGQRMSVALDQYRDRPPSMSPSTPRYPSLPMTGIGAGPSTAALSPIVPLSAGPSYNPANMQIPISQKPRAYPQQPTYINQPSPKPAYAPPQVPREEVCVECAMRDQDMADVDVTSPGIWERESDAMYEDLLRREEEEDAAGIPHPENRPRAKGGILTEANLRLWLSVNPKEPSSRQQTLDQYVRSQRTLLEAETLARARAIRESRQLDDKMRDAYSQLRRSAYELGTIAQPDDDSGGLRIKAPHTPLIPSSLTSKEHSREVTLLENGMIVEHVDVKREERERKREEKRERSRARKSSRSSRSGADVTSIYSLGSPGSPGMPTDSGFFSGVRPDSRFSQSLSARPSSVLTAGEQRPPNLRAQSQASFSDLHSIGSTSSPRRSRFFGFKNLSAGWRSSDSLAPSGSMIDMHVALQREEQYLQAHPEAVDIGSNAPTLRLGDATWPNPDTSLAPTATRETSQSTTKKPKGFKKIWKIVTGTNSKSVAHDSVHSRSMDRADDDGPLAPPPPLSYLVNRERGASARRHVSTPSLPTSTSPNLSSAYMPSPPTAPSSLVPSPTSSRPSGGDDGLKMNGHVGSDAEHRLPSGDSMLPESDSRGRTTRSSSRTLSSFNGPLTPSSTPSQRPMSAIVRRDKSLPPLPGESSVEFPNHPMPEARPQTMFTYDPRIFVGTPEGLAPPQAAFRTLDTRRQSFGGVGSQPHLAAYTLPTRGVAARQLNVPPFLAEEKFSEFGASPMAMGQWPLAQKSQRSLQVPTDPKPKKRKSKFGLSSLFGKKAHGDVQVHDGISDTLEFPGFRISHSDTPYETAGNGNGYGNPMSIHSGHTQRPSLASKKNIELVDQDRDFIAYRYPSTEATLNLMR
ncbi:unnamed protein product [Somion occarium]|uniref:Proteophosphoglycan ppg4 n=1 Tax=Somion occarium TaxID=3059160 RepID=A0ABP1DJB6_9APHY